MSQDAGYILDKSPNFEVLINYIGDELADSIDYYNVPTDTDDWYIAYNPSATLAENQIIDNALFLDGTKDFSNNGLYSPKTIRNKQIDSFFNVKFDMKLEGSISPLGHTFVYIDNSKKDTHYLALKSTTDTLDNKIVAYTNVDSVTISIDATEWHRYNIFASGTNWLVYIDGELKATVDAENTTPDDDIILVRFTPTETTNTSFQVSMYVKNIDILFNSTFKDGYNNLKSSLCKITSNQELASFPVDNISNSIPNKPAVFISNTIEIIMKSEYSLDVVTPELEMKSTHLAIIGHNISSSAIISISYGDSLTTLTTENIPWNKEEIIYEFSNEVTASYYVLKVIDLDNDNNIIIGEVILGKPVYFSECFFWGVEFETEYNNITHLTDFKAKWIYHLNSIKSVKNIDFSLIRDDTVIELYDLFEEADGSRYPVLFFWDTRSGQLGVIYGNLQNEFNRKLTFVDVNDVEGLEIVGLPYAKAIRDDVT